MKKTPVSALQQYALMMDKEQEKQIRLEQKTYTKAIKEIRRLRNELLNTKIENAVLKNRLQKRSRGRPKKGAQHSFSGSALGNLVSPSARPKAKIGRPVKCSDDEKRKIIENYDNLKSRLGNPKMTDKKLLNKIGSIKFKNAPVRNDKKKKIVDRLLKQLKTFRDETGIRQKPKKSGKLLK